MTFSEFCLGCLVAISFATGTFVVYLLASIREVIKRAISTKGASMEQECPICGLPMSDGNGCHMAKVKETK